MKTTKLETANVASNSAGSKGAKIRRHQLKKLDSFKRSSIAMKISHASIIKLSSKNDKELLEVRKNIKKYNRKIAGLVGQEQKLEKFGEKCLWAKMKWAENNKEVWQKHREGKELVIDTSDQDTTDSSPLTTPYSSPDVSSPSNAN
ncbi:hypothetical protein SBOR_2583 [Sclerotinia borealis F-4128]|uniref:Uncharacterized protein n=1 Tax=Sclerotinia borealis (strain F-4128) TaxID=1432307 RepID=W9CLX8_SCLBF|nr:hypothetical protein SBOR_2583 [Sclerotinia borealis F-4128]